ncbi:MAG: hypothetical protein H6726_32480 [Sandaracinaceae bacterium]|nr:hypothetical protein [Sandaracinaceae bacterium]
MRFVRRTMKVSPPLALLACLLSASCSRGSQATPSTVAVTPSAARAHVPERYALEWPPMSAYEDSLVFVPEGLSAEHGNGALCHTNDVQDAETLPDGSARCVLPVTSQLIVGGEVLLLGLVTRGFEHDGMYGRYRGVVAGVDAGQTDDGRCCRVRPVALFTQWDHEVYDAGTQVVVQGHVVLDLDGDGRTELCVEERQERGPGLFELMDLEERGERWTPTTEHRARFAYTFDGERLRLLDALSPRCPVAGYQPFIPQPDYPDGVGWRASVGAR